MKDSAENRPVESAQLPDKAVKSFNGILNLRPKPPISTQTTEAQDSGQTSSTVTPPAANTEES